MEKGIISVIIPVYNVEKQIRKCLDSIIKQTYKKLEIILVDDGSIDDSGKICDEYAKKDKRLKVVHKENGGVSSARNVGLKEANGEYIAFVDADDWIDSSMYEEMLEQLQQHDVDIVKCGFYRDDDNEAIEQKYIFEKSTRFDMQLKREEILTMYATKKMHADICFLLIKKEYIDRIEKFNTDIILGEDLMFTLDLMCSIKSIYYYNKSFYHYYTNVSSATKSVTNIEKKVQSLLNLYPNINRILERYNIKNETLKRNFATLCFNKIFDILKMYIFVEKKMDAVDMVLRDSNMKELINQINSKDLSLNRKIYLFLMEIKCKRLIFGYCYIMEWIIQKINK